MKKIALFAAALLLAIFLLLALVGGIVYVGVQRGLLSVDAAAWVQAIGATVGIAVAIWIPFDQKRATEKAEGEHRRETGIRLCKALQDELCLLQQTFTQPIFLDILHDRPGKPFNIEIPVSANPHPVYASLVGRLVDIDDAETRRSVIVAYGRSSHLQEMIALNTKMLYKYGEVFRASRSGPAGIAIAQFGKEEDQIAGELVRLRPQLKDSAERLMVGTSDALVKLEAQIRAID